MMKFAMKNKWLLLVLLLWGIIFSVPRFRNILHAWYDGSPWIQFTLIPNVFWMTPFDIKTTELPMKVNVLNSIFWLQTPKSLDDIDRLIHENPNVPWLIAFRLQATMSKFNNNRIGGELADADVLQHIKSGIPSPETNKREINFSPVQLKQTLAFCRMGEKVEPQNAYFSWMRAYFLLINRQDEKAWQALDDASRKTYWNNHFTDYKNLYAKAFRKIINRPLLPYEKYSIPSGHGLSRFGTFSKTREMARVITWEGIKLNRAGHHDQALRIWSQAYKTFTLAAQGEDDKVDYLVDNAILEVIANGASYPDRATIAKYPKELNTSVNDINSLVQLAQKTHHPDLAKQLKKDWQKNHSLHQKVASPLQDYVYISYHGLHLSQLICVFIVSGVVLILLLLGAVLLWCITSCLNLFLHSEEAVPQKTKIAGLEHVSGLGICSGVLSFIGGLFLIYLITLTRNYDISSGWDIAQSLNTSNDTSILSRIIEGAWGFSIVGIDTYWRILILLTPLVTVIFYVLYKRNDERKNSVRHPVLRRTLKILHLLLVLAAWGTLVMISDYQFPQIIAAAIICAFLAISFGWMCRKSRSINFTKLLKQLQSITVGLICLNSILILALLMCQLAVGNRLQPWADNQLRGEMHEYHHVINAAPTKRNLR